MDAVPMMVHLVMALALVGGLLTLAGLAVVWRAVMAACDELRWRSGWRRELREGLRVSIAEGWNTSELPDGAIALVRIANWRAELMQRRGDHVHGRGCSSTLDNITGWLPVPEGTQLPRSY